jgi:hypothetical protein
MPKPFSSTPTRTSHQNNRGNNGAPQSSGVGQARDQALWAVYAEAVARYQASPSDAAALRVVHAYSTFVHSFLPADADSLIAELKRNLGLKGGL